MLAEYQEISLVRSADASGWAWWSERNRNRRSRM